MINNHICICILSFNNEDFIEKTISSIGEYCDIWLCDSGSSDKTINISKKLGANIIQRKMTNWDAGDQRNWAFKRLKDRYQWILFLDSDELMTDSLKKEIDINLSNSDKKFGSIRSMYTIFDKPLKNISIDTFHDRLVRCDQENPIFSKSPGEVFNIRKKEIDSIIYFEEGYIHNVLNKGFKDWIKRLLSYSFDNGIIDGTFFVNKEERAIKDKSLMRKIRPFFGPILPAAYILFYLIKRKSYLDGLEGIIFTFFVSVCTVAYFPGWLVGILSRHKK